jgi:hypothetical protein
MDIGWRSEVERPWVGMTSESMTEVERARGRLVSALEVVGERLRASAWPARASAGTSRMLRLLRSRPVLPAAALAGVTVVVAALIPRRRRREPMS